MRRFWRVGQTAISSWLFETRINSFHFLSWYIVSDTWHLAGPSNSFMFVSTVPFQGEGWWRRRRGWRIILHSYSMARLTSPRRAGKLSCCFTQRYATGIDVFSATFLNCRTVWYCDRHLVIGVAITAVSLVKLEPHRANSGKDIHLHTCRYIPTYLLEDLILHCSGSTESLDYVSPPGNRLWYPIAHGEESRFSVVSDAVT